MEKYTWIQTRDGSPTLWSNGLSEPFRSIRGAYTESYKVFIEPCLESLRKNPRKNIVIGEFGLGPGTNWLMSQLFLRPHLEKLCYFAIEREPEIFQTGRLKWIEQADELSAFAATQGVTLAPDEIRSRLEKASRPLLFPTLDLAYPSGLRVDFWFHDPFGYDVNPEGYSEDALHKCRVFFEPHSLGCTYACNKYFQTVLEKCKFKFETLPSGDPLLKRERLVFKI